MACSRSAPETVSRPELSLPVDALGGLTIQSPSGVELVLRGEAGVLRLDVGTPSDLLRLFRDLPPRAARRRLSGDACRIGRLADLELAVVLGRREVARIDRSARSHWLARLLGLGPVQLRIRNIAIALIAGNGVDKHGEKV